MARKNFARFARHRHSDSFCPPAFLPWRHLCFQTFSGVGRPSFERCRGVSPGATKSRGFVGDVGYVGTVSLWVSYVGLWVSYVGLWVS